MGAWVPSLRRPPRKRRKSRRVSGTSKKRVGSSKKLSQEAAAAHDVESTPAPRKRAAKKRGLRLCDPTLGDAGDLVADRRKIVRRRKARQRDEVEAEAPQSPAAALRCNEWAALSRPSSSEESEAAEPMPAVSSTASPRSSAWLLESVITGLAVPADWEVAAREATAAVARASAKAFGSGAYVLPFGSVVQGSHLLGSDLDLCIHVPQLASSLSSPDNSRQVAALRQLMCKLPGSFDVIETRFSKTIRVPIIVLAFVSSTGCHVEVDVSIGVKCGKVQKGFVDRLVRRVLARAPQVLPFVQIVKHWARVERLNKAYEGCLNSLGWTLLVLFWFMERGEICASLFDDEEPWEKDFCGSSQLPPPLNVGLGRLPSFQELKSFFIMVAGFSEYGADDDEDGVAWGISLVDHSVMPGPGMDTAPFFVEDPGARLGAGKSENVARALRDHTWRATLRRCRMVANALHQEGQDAAAVFRKLLPRPPAGEKRKRLPIQAPLGDEPAAGKRKKLTILKKLNVIKLNAAHESTQAQCEPAEQSDDTASTTASSQRDLSPLGNAKRRVPHDAGGDRAWHWKQ